MTPEHPHTTYCCPVCAAVYHLEYKAGDQINGLLTCPLCGAAALRVEGTEREMLNTYTRLRDEIQYLTAQRKHENTT